MTLWKLSFSLYPCRYKNTHLATRTVHLLCFSIRLKLPLKYRRANSQVPPEFQPNPRTPTEQSFTRPWLPIEVRRNNLFLNLDLLSRLLLTHCGYSHWESTSNMVQRAACPLQEEQQKKYTGVAPEEKKKYFLTRRKYLKKDNSHLLLGFWVLTEAWLRGNYLKPFSYYAKKWSQDKSFPYSTFSLGPKPSLWTRNALFIIKHNHLHHHFCCSSASLFLCTCFIPVWMEEPQRHRTRNRNR